MQKGGRRGHERGWSGWREEEAPQITESKKFERGNRARLGKIHMEHTLGTSPSSKG